MEFSVRSKKCAANNTDQSSTFVPEEIVANILSRLQIKPLFRLKLVSKRWNSIISNPALGQNYLQRALSSPKSSYLRHLCVMLSNLEKSGDSSNSVSTLGDSDDDQLPSHLEKSGDLSNSVSTLGDTGDSDDDQLPSLYMPTFSQSPINEESTYRILASSSGLILCRYPSSIDMRFYLCVANPLSKQSVLLPPLDVYTFRYAVGFATRAGQPARDNPTNLTYKVVVIFPSESRGADSNDSTVMAFSSDKGNWTCKEPIACPKELFSAAIASSCKGVLYWFHWSSRSIVTYDPYDTPDSFGVIQIPSGSDNILRNSSMKLIQLGQEDVLKYCDIECCSGNDRRLRVWRLVDYSKGEWYLEQKCPISPQLSDRVLSGYRPPLVDPQPQDENSFLFLFGCLDKFTTIDLMSAEEALVGIEAVSPYFDMKETTPYFDTRELVPITLCLWSSPFYGQVRGNSSSIVGF